MNKPTQFAEENSTAHAVAKCESSSLKKIAITSKTATEQLMPYGAAAKAIYVRANGLSAYNKAYRCENYYCAEHYEQTSA